MIELLPASADDLPFLREILAVAADWRPGSRVRTGDEMMADSNVAHYVAGWPRAGDFGVVARDEGEQVGAAWCRSFDVGSRGYGFVAADVPELTIGVVPARRGAGTGRRMLEAIVDEARRRGVARVSLSVEADNPAIHLYRSVGFVELTRPSGSPTMVLDCRPI